MSGVIKFRVWDEKRKAYTYAPDEFSSSLGPYFLTLDGRIYIDGVFQKHLLLEQSTGLLDRNGKEIYEGDIVRVDNAYTNKFIVEYNAPKFTLFDGRNGVLDDPHGDVFDGVEVFGNIHEEAANDAR
jgi:uncharacterized phage protein (TIGR01671 family)